MRVRSRILLLVAPLVMVVGCSRERPTQTATQDAEPVDTAAAESQVDPAQARGEIEAAKRQLVDALNRGDVAGFVQVYAEDARILPPDMAPAEGRQSIEQFWAGGVQQLGIRDLQRTTDELEVFGETAYEQGRYQFNTNQGPATGKYLVIWKRTPAGWRLHREIWNPSPAGA